MSQNRSEKTTSRKIVWLRELAHYAKSGFNKKFQGLNLKNNVTTAYLNKNGFFTLTCEQSE